MRKTFSPLLDQRVKKAEAYARAYNLVVTSDIMLASLIDSNPIKYLFEHLDAKQGEVRERVWKPIIERAPLIEGSWEGKAKYSGPTNAALRYAIYEAENRQAHTPQLGCVDLILGLAGEEHGFAGQFLRSNGFSVERMRYVSHFLGSYSSA